MPWRDEKERRAYFQCEDAFLTVAKELDAIDRKIRAWYPSDTWNAAHKIISNVYRDARGLNIRRALIALEPLIKIVGDRLQGEVMRIRSDLKRMEDCERFSGRGYIQVYHD